MKSDKSMLWIALLAVIGAGALSQLTLHSSFAFLIGVVATTLICKLSTQPTLSSSQDEETSSTTKTLYVGNLPYKANESHVKELFAEYGEVFAVRLMKDKRTGKRRGFGFVVIAAGQAQTAIDALNEKEYMQRTLKVRIANDPKSDEEMAEQD
ncbi:RNA recognition motif domain-containing protein [Vibrio cholerae]|uniref:RNA recognition motif domain-containing protein n=1 Tax=Vibrio cholerae TaxID=666 RepID=UPI0002735411|nr:RNA-binding protein [Vibrio cholerae]EGR3628499.1 RNA-binding protein [Vibrio cholerae]EGR3853284.1 RNA-binding protein [Vibrio cholerae]EGR4214512.1 RNA-binding protein [Vibrio cholerae]EGR4481954.1 RNA-binding protein [Vibrio cholerae]EJH67370.1 ss-DNA binding 12RNP2 domain protein [Vibrio cholerae HE-45]